MTDSDTTHTEQDEQGDELRQLRELGYEQARDQLIEVVRALEAGGLSLEESLALWEKGEVLAQVCERHLDGARQRIDAALATVDDTGEADEDGEAGASATEPNGKQG
ncbi:exodeoxyribonuclease VII small subunit [Haloechinothrix sp. LS1_15]|uniref:exodeoxyribonuclease VII small subunit n=1 Tax=Haloechinothrix sp. LS1_15 TaxID=2652248 RepID=UPI0029444F5C|nr:exodeoxyribonuclease VII small subunit [Haloechinothrix sp. LS1_15]MDV6011535.1 exodeoxyribonuclease VII small subunit [Haloechinothrix sp. LS1_15]